MKPSVDDIQHALNKAVQIMLKTTQVYKAYVVSWKIKFLIEKVVMVRRQYEIAFR